MGYQMGCWMEGKMECQINVTRLAIAHQKRTNGRPVVLVEAVSVLPEHVVD